MNRRERKAHKDRMGLIIGAVVLIALGVIFGYQVHISRAPKPDEFNCAGEVRRKTAIVIDQTDPVAAQTQAEVVSRVLKYVHDQVQTNEKVSIFGITKTSKKDLVPLYSACRPKSQGNGVTDLDREVRKRFSERFLKPLKSALQIPDTESKESPIAQALVDLSLSDYLRSETATLIVVSDMMENTSKFSLYKCSNSKEAIRLYRESKIGSQERPAFSNVTVHLNVIPTEQIQRTVLECRAGFWNWFFGDSSGKTSGLKMEYLPGYGGK